MGSNLEKDVSSPFSVRDLILQNQISRAGLKTLLYKRKERVTNCVVAQCAKTNPQRGAVKRVKSRVPALMPANGTVSPCG